MMALINRQFRCNQFVESMVKVLTELGTHQDIAFQLREDHTAKVTCDAGRVYRATTDVCPCGRRTACFETYSGR